MNIIIGADHAGYELKEKIKKYLIAGGFDVTDVGTANNDLVDYPEFAEKVGLGVSEGGFDRGILFCGSGIGMAIAANKLKNVRAATGNDLYSARLSREHNDANVLAIGSRLVSAQLAEEIVDLWLNTEFEGGRHQRRIDKISELEKES